MQSRDVLAPWQNWGPSPLSYDPLPGVFPSCGQCGLSTWVELGGGEAPGVFHPNVDIRLLSGVDIVHDFRTGTLPFHGEHADRLRMLHVINHLSLVNARKVLRECLRVLRSDGRFTIMVTDLAFVLERLLSDDLHESWMRCVFGTAGDTYDEDFHYWGYSAESLSEELRQAGFINIQHRGYYNRWEFVLTAIRP